MKAVRIHENGDESVLKYEDAPDPVPAPGEVLIRVRYAALNRGDLGRRRGGGMTTPSFPFIIGWDIAGEVVSLGDGVSGFQPGERVVARVQQGGYAELAAAAATHVAHIPDGVSLEDAASLPVAYLSAFIALRNTAKLQPGETVLIQAASSGVGMAGIQLAKIMGASKVITTTSTPEKMVKAREIGADEVIDYSKEDFLPRVMELTGGLGVDVAIDVVGGEVFARSQQALAEGGRLVCVGRASGEAAVADEELARQKNQLVMPAWGLAAAQPVEEVSQDLSTLLEMVADGRLKTVIDRTFPLSETAEAHRYLAGRNQFGKVMLEI